MSHGSSYMSDEELRSLGISSIGCNVKISRRAVLYEPEKMAFGDHARVDDFCVLSGKVLIGRNVHVTVNNNLAGGSEGVVIHDFATIAYGCNIFSQSDDYSGETMTNSTIPAEFKNEKKQQVVIGKHTIIGTRSTVFPGVQVAEGCSIGAHTLVNRSTEPWSIYVGSPARKIRDRKRDLEGLTLRYLETT
jgi:acetyltransferase-like isoleucine patch superfamily enzyme